jgi:hypothetical protein
MSMSYSVNGVNSVDDLLQNDNPGKPFLFFIKVFASVIAGLCLGSVIDSLCRILQKDNILDWRERSIKKSILFFIIQISINIIIILILCNLFPIKFLEWLQLSISGSFFATLLFITQQNLVNNTLRIFYIQTTNE